MYAPQLLHVCMHYGCCFVYTRFLNAMALPNFVAVSLQDTPNKSTRECTLLATLMLHPQSNNFVDTHLSSHKS